jgi:signal transduction histidine kinase
VREVERATAAVREIVLASQGEALVADVWGRICAAVAGSLDFSRVLIVRYQPAAREVTTVALVGDTPEHIPARLPLGELPLFERAMETQRIGYVADARTEPAVSAALVDAYGLTSLFCVPLFSSDHCLGFLVGDRGGDAFELDEIELAALDMVGVVSGTLLEKALVQEEMQRLASVKQEFVAIASHELRTPLASIYGASVTLDERGDVISDEDRRSLRRTLREQTERLLNLVKELLDLSRFDIAAVDVSPVPIALRAKLEQLVALAAAGDAVSIDVDETIEACVDPVALDRIVSNLLSNALRYGGPPIAIRAAGDQSQLLLAVEDHGAGVADSFVPHLFERFSRSDESRGTTGGSGLGLAIARAYAQAHGGDLFYERIRPHGSRFVLSLPNTAPGTGSSREPARPPRAGPPWDTTSPALRLPPVIVTVSPPEAAHALRELLDDHYARLIGDDRIEIEPIDEVRRGTVIYRVVQASRTVADRFEGARMYFIAEDGNPWRLPPPAL